MKIKILKTSAIWPALLSALVAPGVGQIANREYGKGALLLVASLGSFFWFSRVLTEQISLYLPGTPDQWMNNQATLREAIIKLAEQNASMFMTFQLLVLIVWIFAVVDAYITAKKRYHDHFEIEGGEQ